jgi:hypothetical protein
MVIAQMLHIYFVQNRPDGTLEPCIVEPAQPAPDNDKIGDASSDRHRWGINSSLCGKLL